MKLRDDKNYLVLRLDPEAEWPRLEVVRRIQRRRRALLRALPLGHARAARRCAWSTGTSSCAPAPTTCCTTGAAPACSTRSSAARPRACCRCRARSTASRCATCACSSTARTTSCSTGCAARMKDAVGAAPSSSGRRRCATRSGRWSRRWRRSGWCSTDFVDQDVIGFYREGIALEIVVIAIRQGKMAGSRAFSFTDQEFPDAEILSSFLGLYYDLSPVRARRGAAALRHRRRRAEGRVADRAARRLGGARRRKVEVLVPQRGTAARPGRAGAARTPPPASPAGATPARTPRRRWPSCRSGCACPGCRG